MRRKFDSYHVMVKLVDSLPEAAKLQADSPERYKVGLHGWTTLIFPHSEAPPSGILAKWIVAHKQLVALLPQDTVPADETPKGASAKKKTVRRKTGKKKSATAKKKRSPKK